MREIRLGALTGRVLTASGPGDDLVSYSYDGLLTTQIAWAGTVGGRVAWTYDKKPSESYYQTYWSRLRKLDYEFLRSGDAVATALRFTLSVPGVHTAIVGTTKPERWQENAALLERGQLPNKEFARIRQRWHEVAGDSWEGQV